ncbi:MAG: glycoside hydrolase family 76 protein [Polyangiales bacterium]
MGTTATEQKRVCLLTASCYHWTAVLLHHETRSALALALSLLAGCTSTDTSPTQPESRSDAAVARDASSPATPQTRRDAASPQPTDAAITPDPARDASRADPDSGPRQDAATSTDAAVTADAGTASDASTPEPAAADVAYDAFTELFYTVRNGEGYYVNNSGSATADAWWTQAELIEMAIDAYERKPSARYRALMNELITGFVAKQGSDWTYNDFNDDITWMVIASSRAHLLTQNADFLRYAKQNWDAMYTRAWSDEYGGGLFWKVGVDSKNACINGPGAIAAYLLYKATDDASYLDKAKAIYAWERATLFDAQSGAVYDNINPQGGDKWTFTYNSGTFIGIANYLFAETGEQRYFDDAKLAADFVVRELSDAEGLVKENDISGDGAAFKPIMFRWLTKFVTDNQLEREYLPWLQSNANRAWANRRAGDNISWNNWREATPHRLLDSHGAMATVQILQVVPAGGAPVPWENTTPQDGRGQIEAELCDEKRGMLIEASEADGQQLGGIGNDHWARYGHVDFGARAAGTFEARVSVADGTGGRIELHLDALDGPLLGTLTTTSTGDWSRYELQRAALAAAIGVHELFLVFKTNPGSGFVANLNWFTLR